MSCHHEHNHDHEDPLAETALSLYSCIDHERVTCLNAKDDTKASKILKDWTHRLDTREVLESDVDPELIVNIPLTGSAKIYSILIRSFCNESAPCIVKVYKNRQDVDFELAGSLEPQLTVTHPQHIGAAADTDSFGLESSGNLQSDGICEYSVNRAHFSNVTHLSIYVQTNHGAESTKLVYIGLRGDWTKLSKEPVITLYESAANPRDHVVELPQPRTLGL